MSSTLRILLLEDSAVDAEQIKKVLNRTGTKAVMERVDSKEMFTRALAEFAPDVVLANHSIASFDARAALAIVQAQRPATPVILVTETLDEQLAVDCLRAGAEGIVLKGNLGRLAPVIEAALSVRQRLETLTARQLEVLRLVAEGNKTREIARRLKLSVKTIETHRGEVMKRLGIHDLVGLVRYAIRLGLVPPES
jgi:DNA-binding NarL/FixJ family response regulator